MGRLSTRLASCALLAIGLLTPAPAAARGDLAAACRADVQRLCPGIAPGGGQLKRCIQEHTADLSPACRQAIAARRERGGRGPGGAPGPARGACRDDVARFCPEAMGDRERLRRCLRVHASELSDGCKRAIAARRQQRRDWPR